MSVLQELVRDKGVTEAARVLGINYKTVARSRKAGRLSKKMRWALERTLQSGDGCDTAEQREHNVRVWKRLDELEKEIRSRIARQCEEYARQRDDHARHRRRVERQLAALVLGNAVTAPETPGIEENGADESGVAGTSGPPW